VIQVFPSILTLVANSKRVFLRIVPGVTTLRFVESSGDFLILRTL
jgi:hypothetical protein